MQLDAQVGLDLAERAKAICFLDIETTGLHGDYNSVLVVAIKPWGGKVILHSVTRPGDDKEVVEAASDVLERYTIWVSYYGKMFDIPIIQTRRLLHGLPILHKKHHIDLYFHLKSHIKTGRRSQGHLLNWLKLSEQKMSVSAEEWNRVLRDPEEGLKVMRRRCASDARGLEALYKRTRHLIGEVTK